ncbi:DUF1499 domain-containing protein [Bacillus subtilis]|uniref:DUF1499 domain-containing protein n=1 Tax=Pseudochrobactrum asaccharolyticum TaxID=354351 RepID=UPI001F1892F2|nr:DUF1499 domain-containing protein [Pseudochrobactrum asaccharolyticum]MCF7643815.1 DUF1499 domain-containing protein [Pseudochrobactrum asaccharolyticum]MCF7670948.1 DUF1499 domain-containing protein [Bacillus subtilis]
MLDNYYIRRKTSRRHSRTARYAPACASVGFVLLIAALALHRFNLIQQPDLVFLVTLSVGFAALALLLSAKSFYNLWRSGDAGGRRALRASFIAVLTLVPPALVLVQISAAPRIHDISTDLENSVEFNTVMENVPDLLQAHEPNFRIRTLFYLGLDDLTAQNSLSTDAVPDMLQQISAYPEVSGRQYDSAQDHVLKAVLKVMKEQGITVTGSAAVAGEDIDVSVEGVAKTLILGLRSDLAVRLRDEAEQTTVDMRAVSRYGRYDLGFNAALIENFFNALDLEMRNAVPDAPEE